MLKPLTILTLVLACTFTACKKDRSESGTVLPTPTPTPPVVDDKATIMLKDVVESGLPSPYFHFTYNDSNYVSNIKFADGFFDYDVNYSNKRVSFLVNSKNNARLDYCYTNGLVSCIQQTIAGEKKWSYAMVYADKKLVQVQWFRFTSATDSVVERKIDLTYGADGNLSEYKDYSRDVDQLKLTRTFQFSDYDQGTNVDDFYLFKSFFEDVIFLPGIKLQKNNARLLKILGDQNDFEVRYTYTYSNQLPVQRSGIFRQTRGGTSADTNLTSTFSYY